MVSETELEGFQQDLLEWSEDNLRDFPWRGDSATPYLILISEIFLKQTRSQTVASVIPEFIERFPDPSAIRRADREDIIEIIRPLGIYNHRADALIEIADSLSDDEIPANMHNLEELPQVGPYVSNAVLCFAFGERRPIVDSNVRRIYRRLFQGTGKWDDEIQSAAERFLPESEYQRYNQALLDFGAEVCTDSTPSCEECFASSYCGYYQQRAD